MLKIAHKDDNNAMLRRCEGANDSVACASIRIMTSHFVALLVSQFAAYTRLSVTYAGLHLTVPFTGSDSRIFKR